MSTSTTNYSFTLPEVGGDTDQWGTQLNSNWTLADTTLKTIADSVGDEVTLTGNDYLTISGQAITVGDVDLTTDVTGTLPVGSGGTGLSSLGTANQVLAVNGTADGLEFQTVSGSGTVTSVSVTGSDGIEVDSGSPVTTSGTIALGINATTLSTHLGLGTAATTDATAYATSTQGSTADSALQDVSGDTTPQLGGNLDVVTYSIVSTSARDINLTPDTTGNVVLGNFSFDADQTVGLSQDNYVLTYDNSSGQISLEAASVTESQISDFGTYQTADQALTDISGLAVTDGNFIVADGTNWVAESGATARASLGLTIGSDVEAYSSTNADYADTTANFTGTLQNGGSNVLVDSDIGSTVQAAGSYLTSVDLTSNVTNTLPVANGGTGLTAIGTAGQVLKVNSGATALEFVDESGGFASYIEHSSTVSDSLAISAGTNRMYVGNTSFSGSGTMAGYLLISHGYANFTNASALNVTGTLRVMS